MPKVGWLLTLAILSMSALLWTPAAGAAPSGTGVHYNRFDVEIAIAANGDFRVTEYQDVYFGGGPYQRASRTIGLASVVDIRDVVVAEGGQAYRSVASSGTPETYKVTRGAGQLRVDWYFPPTSGASRAFALSYTIVGGLRVYPTVDVLDWAALRPDLPASAEAATVTVTLPADVARSSIATDSRGAPATASVPDARTVRFDTTGVPRGKGLEVKVTFPHGLVSAAPPPWQSQFDQQTAVQQAATARQNLLNLLLGAAGILVLVGGGLVVYLLWYFRGRDYHTGLVAEYLREPPSDASPGVAGTLLDERADLQDVLGTFTDLARRGVLKMDEVSAPGPFGAQREFAVTKTLSDQQLTPFERTIVDTIFPGEEVTARLGDVKGRFALALPRFKEQLYDEVVQRGYFNVSPEAVRARYRTFGTVLIALAIVGWVGLTILLSRYATWQLVPALALFIVGLALRSVARAMPAKTERGANEAAKWNAFRRYLENLERYDNLESAKGIFDRYLPYATAFGLDKSWIKKFAAVNAPVPSWYGGGDGGGGPIIVTPGGWYGGGYGGGLGGGPLYPSTSGGGGLGGGDLAPGGGGWNIPSLQDVSNSGGGGLQSFSDGLMSMLDSASSVFGGGGGGGDGGGWSGGGGDFGGGGSDGGGGDFG